MSHYTARVFYLENAVFYWWCCRPWLENTSKAFWQDWHQTASCQPSLQTVYSLITLLNLLYTPCVCTFIKKTWWACKEHWFSGWKITSIFKLTITSPRVVTINRPRAPAVLLNLSMTVIFWRLNPWKMTPGSGKASILVLTNTDPQLLHLGRRWMKENI